MCVRNIHTHIYIIPFIFQACGMHLCHISHIVSLSPSLTLTLSRSLFHSLTQSLNHSLYGWLNGSMCGYESWFFRITIWRIVLQFTLQCSLFSWCCSKFYQSSVYLLYCVCTHTLLLLSLYTACQREQWLSTVKGKRTLKEGTLNGCWKKSFERKAKMSNTHERIISRSQQ